MDALLARQYNIGVGISLGNKWFTPENIYGLTEWALEYTKDKTVIYTADTIHALNIEARDRTTPKRAQEMARSQTDKLISAVKVLIENSMTSEQRAKIDYANWDDVETSVFKHKVEYLYKQYKTNYEFRTAIRLVVVAHINKEERHFSEVAVEKMARYILEELPEIVASTEIKGVTYQAYVYPFDNHLAVLVEQIQKSEVFLEIGKHLLDAPARAFLEVR